MKPLKNFVIFLVIFMFGSCAFAFDANIYKLDDGQTVIIKSVKNNPIVIIDTWVKTGSINENDKNNGVSHFLEHLFFKGTATHPTGDFDKILESKGAITNAATSKDFTHFYITIASEYFDKALELHADMLLHPQIPRKEMEKERKVVLEEIAKDANSPQNICYENLNKMMYTTDPYKRRVIGSAKVIETVSRDDVLNYYKKYYSPSNMTTIIVGDVDPAHVLELAKKDFNEPYQNTIKNSYKKEHLLTTQKQNTEYMQTNSGYMLMGFRGADVNNNDTYALDVLSTILGDGTSSKLYQSVKEQKQLVNSISTSNSTMKEDGIFSVNSNFVPQNALKVENAIWYEINKIKEFGVSDSDLKIAKKMIESDTYYTRRSSDLIASELGYISTLTNSTDYYNTYLPKINKVTAYDVKRVANKYLTTNNSAISFVLPKGEESKQEVSTSKTHKAQLLSSNSTTKKYQLDNNATLLLTDSSYNDIVAISISAKGGNFLENKKGTSKLFADLLLKGTKQYSAIELSKLLEENGINISFNPGSDTFQINIQTTTKQLETTLNILNDILNNSTFDDIDIEKDKTVLLNKIKQERDNPLSLALDGYRSEIFGNSTYSSSNALLEKSLPQVNRTDIISYRDKILGAKNIIISVNGKTSTDLIINKFSGIFKDNSATQFDYKNYTIPKLTKEESIIKKLDNQKKAWLILGWQTDGVMNLKDYATLEVMNTMLGSGMSSRLFKSIREQEGLAYQLGSSFRPNILAGAFSVYVGTNPQTLEKSKSKVFEEIDKFKTQFVSDKELNAAKERLLGEFVIALETNADKATTLGWLEASGRGYKFIDNYKDLINSVTVSDIVEAANKYFRNNYAMSIVTTK